MTPKRLLLSFLNKQNIFLCHNIFISYISKPKSTIYKPSTSDKNKFKIKKKTTL